MKKMMAAVATCVCALGLFVGSDASAGSLPSEYQEVEYIESTSGQFFDTGVVINENHELQFKYAMLAISAYKGPFGTYISDDHNATRVMARNGSTTSLAVSFMTKASGGNTVFEGVTAKAGDIVEGYMNYNRARFNDVEQDLAHTTFGTADTSTLKLLGRSGYSTSIRLYYFRILENGEAAHDYVPCYLRSDVTKVGLYDVIGNEFYTASGLRKGEDVYRNCVIVSGDPQNYAAAGSPVYGFVEKSADEHVELSAPEKVEVSDGVRAYCMGWKLYDIKGETLLEESDAESRLTCSFDYSEPVRLVWQWDLRYPVTVSAAAGLTVTPESAWGSVVAPAEFTVAGADVPYWSGEGLLGDPRAKTVAVAPTAATEISVKAADVREPTDIEGLKVAIASSADGDVVILPDGTNSFAAVTQDEMTNELAITKAVLVTSRSGDPKDVMIDLGGTGYGFTLKAPGARLRGVTFTSFKNLGDSTYRALPRCVNVVTGTVDGCVFRDMTVANSGTKYRGAHPVQLWSAGLITGCVFSNLTSKASYPGVLADYQCGAIFAQGGVISNSQFYACSMSYGAVFTTASAMTYIEDCLFSNITGGSGAVYACCGSSKTLLTMRRTTVANNSVTAVYMKASSSNRDTYLFEDCIFTNNSATVFSGEGRPCVVCDRCLIADNTGSKYGVVAPVQYNVQTFRNCLIRGNCGKTVAGVTAKSDSATTFKFENCTVIGNKTESGTYAAIGMDCGNAQYQNWIKNCIVWGNTGGTKQLEVSADKVFSSCYPEAVDGNANGNISQDPQLNADGTLKYSSPCLDVALDLSSTAGTKDFVGTERPQAATERGAVWDMGCFEMPPNEAPLEVSIVLDQTLGASPATLTATAKTSGTDLTGLVYDWTVTHTTPSGSTVTEHKGRTDENLVLEGLEPGSYAIAVKVTNASGDEASSTCDDTFAAKPAVCYVSTSGSATWPYDEPAKAAKIFADALANAAARVEILAGEYDAAEMGTMTDASFGTFLGVVDAAVEVRGAGTGATVIDFGNAGAGFLVKNAGARVDGLTLLNAASTAAAFNGAAFRVNAGVVSNVVVSGGAIWGSSVYVNSGALFTSSVVTNLTRCSGKDSAYPVAVSGGRVEDTVIAGNRVYNNGGIRILDPADKAVAQVRRVRVLNNVTSNGTGGLDCSTTATVTDSEFTGNVSTNNGTVSVINLSTGILTMRNCRVANNSFYKCKGAVTVGDWSKLYARNVLSAGNRGLEGAAATADYPARGVWVHTSAVLEFINCTVANNVSPSTVNGGFSAGGVSNSAKTIRNCVFWGNRGIAGEGSANAEISSVNTTVRNCCWPEAPDGDGCTSADPKLSKLRRYRYYPSPAGSCYEAGNATGWTDADVDLAGKPRLRDGKIDIGCYQAVPLPGLLLMLK